MRRRRWPVVVVVLGVLALLTWYVGYTQHVVRQLQAAAATQGRMYSKIYFALLNADSTSAGDKDALLIELSDQITRSGLPIILTDADGRVSYVVNLPARGALDTAKLLREFDRANPPILKDSVGGVHYGDSQIVRGLRVIPVLQAVAIGLLLAFGLYALLERGRAEREKVWAGMAREAKAYEDNLYRLCGDWMKGTQAVLPSGTAMLGPLRVGGREMELREYRGHTDSDLVLVDKASGVVFAGGLVFAQRIPTTPHAQVGAWLGSLQSFSALPLKTLVPSHGPVRSDASAVGQTQRYLQWLDRRFTQAAEQGVEMNELLRAEVPAEFLGWAAFGTEYTRNVAHLYPRYEQAVLGGGKAKP